MQDTAPNHHPILPYRLTFDLSEIDLTAVHAYLKSSYWSPGIPLETVDKAWVNSLCIGVIASEGQTIGGQTVGGCRMITDKATFAYLADVYLLQDHRGQGLGKWMVETLLAHKDLVGLRKILLTTRDMYPLYRAFGFESLTHPDRLMEINRPATYEAS